MWYPAFIIILFLLIVCIRQVNQGHIGVKYRLGKYIGMRQPGWRIVIPIFESMKKVDIRVKAVDVPDQEAITKDNISARINAVIYYRVSDSDKAVNEVEDFRYAVSQLAQTTMRNVVGELELDQLLSERESASTRIRDIVDKLTDPWGIKVENVELKDITLPEEMKRVIGKQAEAERERRSVVIKAQGEVEAAVNLSQAAGMLSANPGALHLRTLSTLNDLSSDQSNTVVFAVPLEILRAFEGMADKGRNKE